jgi:hypothetical protein
VVLDAVLRYLIDHGKIHTREDLGVRLYRAVQPSQATIGPAPAAMGPVSPPPPQPQSPSPQAPSPPRAYVKPAAGRARRRTNRPGAR